MRFVDTGGGSISDLSEGTPVGGVFQFAPSRQNPDPAKWIDASFDVSVTKAGWPELAPLITPEPNVVDGVWSLAGALSQDAISIAHNGTGTIVIGGDNSFAIYVSTDWGETWASQGSGITPQFGLNRQVVWDGARFVLMDRSEQVFTSPDGLTWSLVTGVTGLQSNPASLAYDPIMQRYWMVGAGSKQRLSYSDDLLTWTEAGSMPGFLVDQETYQQLFVTRTGAIITAALRSSSAPRVATSFDQGQTWTETILGASSNNSPRNIVQSRTGRIWLGVEGANTNNYSYSDDEGATWTDITITGGTGAVTTFGRYTIFTPSSDYAIDNEIVSGLTNFPDSGAQAGPTIATERSVIAAGQTRIDIMRPTTYDPETQIFIQALGSGYFVKGAG